MNDIPLLKRHALGEAYTGPEPLQLWLLPIHLRPRRKYYEDLVAEAERRIEDTWAFQSFMFESRDDFDNSGAPDRIWRLLSPAWWGFADIVGFIDVRMHATEIAASLFTTRQRPSKVLKEKSFVFRRVSSIAITAQSTSEGLRPQIVAAVEELAKDSVLKGRYLDLSRWRPLVDATDIANLYNAEFA
jgi:hypothetical protein